MSRRTPNKHSLVQICHKSWFLVAAMLLFGGRATGGLVVVDPGGGGHPYYQSISIPPGHMPPPGKCRIWFPDPPPASSRDPASAATCVTGCRRARS